MARLNRGPDVLKDQLRAIQLALVEARFEQLDLWRLGLRQHNKLQANLLPRHELANKIAVEQKLLGLLVGLGFSPCRPGRFEVLYHDRIVGLQKQVNASKQIGEIWRELSS